MLAEGFEHALDGSQIPIHASVWSCACSSLAVILFLRGMRRRSSSASSRTCRVSGRFAMSWGFLHQGVGGKGRPQAHHGPGVEMAMAGNWSCNSALRWAVVVGAMACQVGLLRHAAVLHAVQSAVAQVWAQGRQHGLDAPAALLAGMVIVLARDGQQIHHTLVQCSGAGPGRQSARQFTDAVVYETRRCTQTRGLDFAGRNQILGKRAARVVARQIENAVWVACPSASRWCTLNWKGIC